VAVTRQNITETHKPKVAKLPDCNVCGRPQEAPGEIVLQDVTAFVISAPDNHGYVEVSFRARKEHRHADCG
jgi:hypothetical protein